MGKGIVFDLDETLIDRRRSLDVYARELWRCFQRNSTLDEGRFVLAFHDLDGNGRVPRHKFFSDLSRKAFDGIAPSDISDHFRVHAWLKPMLFEGVVEVIETFRDNSYAVGVVTNGGSHSQNSKISNSGLDQYLDGFVISEELGAKKPDPAIYREIVGRLEIDPRESWFIGDDPISDVVGPASYGFHTAWIERYSPWPEEQIRCYKHRVSHISELSDALFGDA